MIRFKEITVKNFLSWGSQETKYDFKTGITRITGKNGSGKSSFIVDAICYALYGKPYRKINQDDLLNTRNNKNLLVSIKLIKNGKTIIVERGLKPKVFNIYIDGTLQKVTAKVTKYQSQLEEKVLEMDYKTFRLMIMKSQLDFTSFFDYTKGEKRSFLEKMFDITIFSFIDEKLKEEKNSISLSQTEIEYEIRHKKTLLEEEKKHLIELQNKQKELSEKHKTQLQERIQELEEEAEKYDKMLSKAKDLDKKYNTIVKNLNLANRKITGIDSQLFGIEKHKNASKKINHIFETYCVGCDKVVGIRESENIFLQDEEQEKQLLEQKDKSNLDYEKFNEQKDKYEKLLEQKRQVTWRYNNIQRDLERARNEYESLDDIVLDLNEDKIKQYQKDIAESEENVNQLVTEINHYDFLRGSVLPDLKKYLFKKYIPFLNKRINEYLKKFNMDTLIVFNSQFNLEVRSRFQEKFKYTNFSEGQKKRIDIAILFAFHDMHTQMSNQGINFMVLDEICSGLDDEGIHLLFDVLHEMSDEKELIIILHNKYFENKYITREFLVSRDKFSKIESIKE